jgi:hypothetical protein
VKPEHEELPEEEKKHAFDPTKHVKILQRPLLDVHNIDRYLMPIILNTLRVAYDCVQNLKYGTVRLYDDEIIKNVYVTRTLMYPANALQPIQRATTVLEHIIKRPVSHWLHAEISNIAFSIHTICRSLRTFHICHIETGALRHFIIDGVYASLATVCDQNPEKAAMYLSVFAKLVDTISEVTWMHSDVILPLPYVPRSRPPVPAAYAMNEKQLDTKPKRGKQYNKSYKQNRRGRNKWQENVEDKALHATRGDHVD